MVDTLSRILIIHESLVSILGIDDLKKMYKEDTNFKDAYKDFLNSFGRNRISWMEYMIQEGILLKGSNLCILGSSMREKIVKEMHSDSLVVYFGQNKTLAQLISHYYWPSMGNDVKKFFKRWEICQHTKGSRQNESLYQTLANPTRPWIQ